jgi:hypothetical protein
MAMGLVWPHTPNILVNGLTIKKAYLFADNGSLSFLKIVEIKKVTYS